MVEVFLMVITTKKIPTSTFLKNTLKANEEKMQEIEIIDKLLKMHHIKLKTQMFLRDLKIRYTKFGSFTPSQRSFLEHIAKENGLLKIQQSTNNKYPLASSFVIPEIKSVFSAEERSEMFQFMRECAMGKHSKEDAKKYSEMIERLLKDRGVM